MKQKQNKKKQSRPIKNSNNNNNSLNNSLLGTTTRKSAAQRVHATYAQANDEAERTWNSIVKYCQRNGHKFVDDSFPPCDKSLFIDVRRQRLPPPRNSMPQTNIVWLSPEHINAGSREKWSVSNVPCFSDIKQGVLGDCWLLSGLAVILEQPALLDKILLTKAYCKEGCYLVRLCHNGEWKTVSRQGFSLA